MLFEHKKWHDKANSSWSEIMLQLPFNHTVTLILITLAVSMLAFSNARIMNRLIFWPPAMQRGQYDRFITHGFVHADGMHLLFNMITL